MTTPTSSFLGARHILGSSAGLQSGETCLLIIDESTSQLAKHFLSAAQASGIKIEIIQNWPQSNHGQEPRPEASQRMKEVDCVLALTRFSIAHSAARQEASELGVSFVSLPQYSEELLSHPMVRFDYQSARGSVRLVSDYFSNGVSASLTTIAGTHVEFDLTGRTGNFCPAYIETGVSIASPPDVEANISPVETATHGLAVVDASITHPVIGKLREPVLMKIENGSVTDFQSDDHVVLEELEKLFPPENPERRVVGELGIGLNPLAKITGVMLSDEGTFGAAHLGLGSNFWVGGKNNTDFHLDFVMREATLVVDGITVLENGILVG